MKQRWEAEKAAIAAIRATRRSSSSSAPHRAGRARGRLRARRGAQVRQGPRAQERLEQEEALPRSNPNSLLKEVTADEIADIVSAWTGIPVTRLMEGELEKLVHMEERLHKRVVGQDEAIVAVSDAVRRARAGLKDPPAADRLVPVPRPDRGRQDGAGPGAGGVHVRRRARHGPHRHERVHGEVRRRHGWSAHRPAMSATRRAVASSPKPSAVGHTRSSSSTRSRRPIRTSSTSSSRSSTMAG